MRIVRLELLRFGPFTDKVLTFRPEAKLHLVFGPNEAGKSSSLAAIGDLLFGFSKRKEFDFLHEATTLRVGAEIVSRSGETLSFRRRRGRKNTLLSSEGDETALQEDVLAPFLGNLGREVFSRAFGLNSETLRQGGEAMLESEGEMGAMLFAAASGLTGLAHIRRDLEQEAERIFAPRASKERRFYQALDRYNAAITAERHNELRSADWKALLGEITDIEQQIGAIKARRAEVNAGLARLQRLKVLEPILSAIDLVGEQLQSFADLPEVPEGFVAECAAALDAAAGAAGQQRVAEEEVAIAHGAVEAVAVDQPFLDRSEAIVDLFSRRGDYLSKLAEMPRLEAERDAFTATLADAALRLGLDGAQEVLRRLPPDAVLQTAKSILEVGLALEAAIAADEKRLAEERAALDLQEAEGPSGTLVDPKPWRDQCAALGPDLKELNEQTYLENTHRNMAQKLKDSGLRLVPQVTDIERMARANLPTRETLAIYKSGFERILQDRRTETIHLEANTRQFEATLQKLAEAEQTGPVAYEETIGLVRADRDRSFQVLRNQLTRHGRLLTPEEVLNRLTQYEEEIVEADRLADEAIADAHRISQIAAYRDKLVELEGQRPQIEARLEELDAEQDRTVGDYNQLFAGAGITPAGPDAMVGWLNSIEELLATRRDVDALAGQIASLERLGIQIRGALLNLADSIGITAVDALPPLALSRLIGGALDDMQDRWTARLTLEGARQAGQLRIAQIEEQLTRSRRQHREWRGRFEQLMPMLGMDKGTTTGGAAAAFAVWQSVPDLSKERAQRVTRISVMRRDTISFAEGVAALAHELMPVLTELPVQGLIDILRERAETARAARARQDDARVRLEVAEAKLATARGAQEVASNALHRLASLLPSESDPRAELDRLERRDLLRAQLAERRKEFELRAEGMSEWAVRSELPGYDRNRALLDAEDLERQSEALHAENNRLYAALGQKQMQREALEGGPGSELAAFERSIAETDIIAAARQWVVRRIAATMLGAAIERHREAQADPLLTRAGQLFATLTGGSFSGVAQDYGEDDQPRLVGLRRTGERVAISGMSEGTRDQLYLALRLAYIEDYAGRAEPVPFIGDDIFQTFDDERTAAGINAFASTSALFQPILFTHHLSVVAIARRALGQDLDYVEL
ncbi:MAG: AAA family ATPase [Devosia sp.]|nr:AAA family ATPase [Devosia sp.]